MASSQIEIASSSPFGCVLRDRNQRDRCRENNVRAAFQKNLKNLVRDHFSTCISISSSSSVEENSQQHHKSSSNNQDCWVGDEQGINHHHHHHQNLRFTSNNSINDNTNGDESFGMSPRQSRILDRWAARQAQEMVSTIERQTREAEILALSNSQAVSSRASSFLRESSPAQSDTSVEMPNVGASSLVQMWEARLNRSNSLNMNLTAGTAGSRTNSGVSCGDNHSFPVEEPSRGFENGDFGDERDESQAMNEDPFEDWESDKTAACELPSSLQGIRDLDDAGESERIKVSDMVKRLTLVNGRPMFLASCSNDNSNEQPSASRPLSSVSNQSQPRVSSQNVSAPMMREPGRSSVLKQAVAEQRSSSQAVNSPRVRERSYALDQSQQRVASEQNISLPRIRARCSALDHAEQRNFLPVGRSPRIRGRQAFNDLLMQMERERHRELGDLVERRAVSRFQQRGRIQSMLRLRFLQRGLASQEQQHLHSTPSHLNRFQISSITLPRERFNTKVEHDGITTKSDDAGSSTIHAEILNNTQELGQSSTSSQISEDSHHQEIDTNEECVALAASSETYASEVFFEGDSPSSEVTWQEASYESNNLDTQEIEENSWDGNETAEEQEADDNQQLIGSNYDWFRDISRPRTHWEGRRQAWYQEMLDSDSDNEEIRQLLERRRVSTFLASDFRLRMDQLMISRLNQQTQPSDSQEEEQDVGASQERMGQLMTSFLRRHTHQVGSQEEIEREEAEEEVNEEDEGVDEEDEAEEEEEEEEGEGSIGHQYHEVSDYFDQTPSSVQLPLPSPISSWSSYRDQEVGNESDQTASTSLCQPLTSQSYYQETRQGSSSINRPSLEMELIYDLRGHMEQLHQEMSELRKSIKSCMDMQVQLQHSFKQEDHSVQGVGKKSFNTTPSKGTCCICYEMQVDSLLYRCGHMCTCLKCAHELQWSSGKCPICRAPIVDVVRAFADS